MAVITVGTGKQYSTIPSAIAAAQDGDTIQVDAGTYVNQSAQITKDIALEGVGGKVKMTSTGLIPNGKGILVTDGNVTIDNFEFSGAKVADNNGAGIRYQSGNLTVNNSGFFDNENGILTNNPGTGNLIINNSEFGNNGYDSPSGQAHGLYVGRIGSLTINNSYFHDVKYGHEIKSRADNNTITNSRIYDFNSTASYSIDQLAADAVQFLDALNVPSATVVGHSMGSFVARRMAERAPTRVGRLIVVGSACTARTPALASLVDPVSALTDPVDENFVRDFQMSTVCRPVPAGFLHRVIADSRRVPAHVWKAALAGQLEYRPSTVPLRCPATVIGGEEDGVFPAAEQRALQRLLPSADFHIEPGIGHAFHWEDPERFVELMR